MSIFEYDEEKHRKSLLEEGLERGLAQGFEQGAVKIAMNMIEDGNLPLEKIAMYSGLPLTRVRELSEELQMV